MTARVIVLAGPSGAGKSRLAERTGLPVLRLDDFYKSGGDPTLPRITEGANAGLVDWDDPASWLLDDAMVAIEQLCRDGRAEVLATSDVPGGVVNILTGDAGEIGPWLAEHADVDAIDLTGAPPNRAMEFEREAAGTVKRVVRAPATEPDWTADPGTAPMTVFLETKTVWHPIGV